MERYSDEVPSFIEARPPLIHNPFMRPRPVKGINLLDRFDEDSDVEEPELVKVYLRMKPCKVPNNLYELRSDKCLVTSLDTTTAGHGRRTQHNVSKMYTFSRIFKADSTQKEVFEQVVKENMKRLVDGYSFTLLTYGASGSGKTYTLMGTVRAPGLVPRALEYLFKLVDAAQTPSFKPSENGTDHLSHTQQDLELQCVKRLLQISAPFRDKYRRMSAQLLNDLNISSTDLANRKKHYVWVSFVEIYNEAVYDLLAPPDKRVKLRLREDSTGNVYVKGVTQAFVRSGEEAYDVMVAGKHKLVVAETGIHAQSSRSHCIFTITMLTKNEGEIRTSHIRFCDLAGCERQRAARNTGARMLESRAINSSLHVLERCMHMLRRKQHSKDSAMVPYRECKLTRILGSGLSGARGEAVTMMVTVNPAPQYAHETRHVLALAVVAKDIHVNNTIDPTLMFSSLESTQDSTIQDFQDENQRLRTENERLHFEVLQAQSCAAQLRVAMEEKQQQSASTMMELVQETKDMMKQFYEKQLATLRSQMKEMEDEFESRMAELEQENRKLARELKEFKEPGRQHLPESNVDRDENNKAEESLNSNPACDTDSDNESESDTDFDESLDPVKQLRMSILHKDTPEKREPIVDLIDEISEEESVNDEYENDITNDALAKPLSFNKSSENNMTNQSLAKSLPVIETNDNDSKNDMTNDLFAQPPPIMKTNDKDSENSKNNDSLDNPTVPVLETNDIDLTAEDDIDDVYEYININAEKDKSECEATFNVSTKLDKTQEHNEKNASKGTNIRGTYFVTNESQAKCNIDEKLTNAFRGTFFVPNREMSFYKETYIENDNENKKESAQKTNESIMKNEEEVLKTNKKPLTEFVMPKKLPETLVSKIIKSFKTRQNSESSLRQFEKLEIAINDGDNTTNAIKSFEINIPTQIMKKKKAYFDDTFKEISIEDGNEHIEETNDVVNIYDKKLKYFEDRPDESKLCDLTNAAKAQEKRLLFDCLETSSTSPEEENQLKNVETNSVHGLVLTAKAVKEAQLYFTEKDKKVAKEVLISKSPAIVRDNTTSEYVPSVAIKKILGESFTKPEILSSTRNERLGKKHDSLDIFASPLSSITKGSSRESNTEETSYKIPEIPKNYKTVTKSVETDNISVGKPKDDITEIVSVTNLKERAHEFIESLVAKQKIKAYIEREELASANTVKEPATDNIKSKNTKEVKQKEKEIAKINNQEEKEIKQEDITLERTSLPECTIGNKQNKEYFTEINVNRPLNDTQSSKGDNTVDEFEKIVKDLTNVRATDFELLVSQEDLNLQVNQTRYIKTDNSDAKEKREMAEQTKKFEEVKYNLRNKGKSNDDKTDKEFEIPAESSKKRTTQKSLRLRRHRNDENIKQDDKMNIINLKMEFSDVTMGLPAVKKDLKDIPSPEKVAGEEENIPPMLGIQSCPSKSVTRSRRKLFTPRAEPLEESPSHADENSTEAVRVLRPSYHRPRARRKL